MESERVRGEFLELWGRLGPLWGVSPTTARVHAWLLTSEVPKDGEELARELELSRGAVSMACRDLIDWGLVHSERSPGTRRTAYRAETDLERAIRGIVATRKRREWDPLLASLRDWRRGLAGERTKDARMLRERLADVEGIVALVDSMAETFLRGGTVQRLALEALVAAARRRKGKETR